jgi:hypothetical protein
MSTDICRRLLDEDSLSSTHYLSSGYDFFGRNNRDQCLQAENIFPQSKKLDLSITTSSPTRIKNIRGENTIDENKEPILPLSYMRESPQELREEVKKKRVVAAPSPDSVMASNNEWFTLPSSNCTLGLTDNILLSIESRFEEQCRKSSVSTRNLSRRTEIDTLYDPDADFFLPDNVIILVKKRRHTKDTEVLDMKGKADKLKSEADEGKHTEDDHLTEHLGFLEGAQEGFKMAVQDIFGPKVVYIGDNTTSNGSCNMHSYNSVLKEVEGPCIHDNSNNFSDENDLCFLDGVQMGLRMVYSDVSSDLLSTLSQYLGPING